MDYANVGSVQIGGPYTTCRAGEGHAQPPRDLRLPAKAAAEERACATTDPLENGPARVSPARDERGRADAARVFRYRARRLQPAPDVAERSRETSTPGFSSRSSACSSTRTSSCASISLCPRTHVAIGSGRAATLPVRAVHRLSDLEVASRLSFFLWSSIPDDRLLTLAERGQLTNPPILERKCGACWPTRAPPMRSSTNFAAQWLNLRRVEEVVVDPERYPNYDLSLLQAFQRETELFVGSTHPRGSQRRRPPERRLHVRQRAAGAALRHSRDLRQPLPPRHAPEPRSARRIARPGRAAGDDVVSGSHVAGAARQMAAEQHLRLACAAASSRRRHQPDGEQAGRGAGVDARAAGAAPAESLVQQLSFGHRSARVRAGEFRRHRRMADG